jgi:hypothetical protein
MTPPAAATAPAVRRARTLAPGRPLTTAPRPRRVSGPARRQRPRVETQRPGEGQGGLALGALAALRSVERNPLLDRLIGGRAWIALVAFALIGIVTLQLGLLKLNAGIGRTLEQEASLQRENAALSIENSERAAGDRVESSAALLGMELVPIGSLRSLTPHPSVDAARAALALRTPVNATSTTEASSASVTASGSATASGAAAAEQPTSAVAAQPSGETPAIASSGSSTGEPSSSAAPAAAASPPGSAESSPAGEATPAGGTQAGPAG